jgi:HEAT repeat protein
MMMRSPAALLTLSLTALTTSAPLAAAQPPRIVNGRVTTQTAASPFAPAFRTLVAAQADAAWIGYAVPVVDGERTMCCADGGGSYVSGSRNGSGRCCGACNLEPSSAAGSTTRTAATTPPTGPIKLEAGDRLVVLFRVAERKVDRVRVFSDDCELDAGGRAVTWLDGVRPADSVALLEGLVVPDATSRNGTMDGAITAIALHRDPAADAALDRLVAATQPEQVRRKVTFWLGNSRGAHGLATLQRLLKADPSIDVRKSAVFGVSQSGEPGAFDALATLARSDTEPRIRAEAVFWLAQKQDARSAGIIMQAVETDSSAEVRKKAVFALSQLKDDAGVSALVNLAKTASDAGVRSESIFWLGQKAGVKAAQAIRDRIDNDPNTEVKKRAVFALSQMPPAEGVPLLINVARTNTNPEVRKQAMFWLGQSKDAKAVSFFEEVLLGKR